MNQIHPYAKAYFEILQDKPVELEETIEALKVLSEITHKEPLIKKILLEPFATAAFKIDLVYKLAPTASKHETLRKLICLLADKRKLHYILELGPELERILAETKNIAQVEVISPQELTIQQLENIKASLEKSLAQEINLKEIVDKSLIAGLIIKTEDYILDNSIKGRLHKMQQNLKANY